MIVKLALVGKPQKHQTEAAVKSDTTSGLLLNHGLGSGKTRSALEIGERTKGFKLIVPPAALQGNFAKEIKKHGADPKNYGIVSLETFRKNPEYYIDKYKPAMVIADEFHRARNKDTMSYEAFAKVRSRFPKMVGLTGSPISNSPTELVPLINTIAGRPVFQNEEAFAHHFIKEKIIKPGFFGRLRGIKPGIKLEPKNMELLTQTVSPYMHSFTGSDEYKKHIPTVKKEIVYVPMDDNQQKYYDFAFGQLPSWAKHKISNNLPPSKRESQSLNTFLSAARQISDSPESFGSLAESPKTKKIFQDIEDGIKNDKNFKSVTYSNFLGSGLNPVAKHLEAKGIAYGMFTGEQKSVDRESMIKRYNTGELRHLLISPAGAEGLDLAGTKLSQIVDPHWNPERIKQVIGRSARYRSHEHLPLEERSVLVREYLAEPQMKFKTKVKKFFGFAPQNVHEIGVDQYIRERSEEKAQLNQSFLNAIGGIK